MSLLVIMLKAALLLLAAFLTWVVFRRGAASTRRMVLAAGIIGGVLLPVLSALLPDLGVQHLAIVKEVDAVAEVVLAPVDDMLQGDSDAEVDPAVSEAQTGGSTAVGATPSTTPSDSGPSSWSISAVDLLLVLWLVGVAIVLGRLLFGLLWTRRVRRACHEPIPARWVESLEAASEELCEGSFPIRLCFTRHVEIPTVAGIIRPTVFLPLEALTWSRGRQRLVLLHELAHVLHHDNLLNLLGQVLCAFHWFNPLSWWAVRCLAIESERAADDVVLEVGTKASDYASELVRIVRDRQLGIAVASPMAKPAELTSRIEWILDARCRRVGWSPGRRAAFWTLGLALVVLFSCATAVEDATVVFDEDDRRSEPTSSHRVAMLARAVADVYGVAPDGVELTIDEPLQGVVDAEVRTLVERYRPRSVSIVALDPCSGHVLALGSHGGGDAEGVVTSHVRALEPGGVLRPITIAAALEEGMSPEARFFCENGAWRVGDRTIRDATPAGWLDVGSVLSRSSSIGTGRIYQDELGWNAFRSWIARFGLTETPQVPLAEVEAGFVPGAVGGAEDLRGVLAANGVGLRVNSLQLTAAYAALANDGVYNPPILARRVVDEEDAVIFEPRAEGRRVVDETTARAVLDMLEASVESDLGASRAGRVDGLRIAGMTGTTQQHGAGVEDGEAELEYSASFVGIVDPDESHLVVLVGVEGIRGEDVSGGQVAAPAFARIVSQAREVSSRVE